MLELILTIFYVGITMYLANIVDVVGHPDNDKTNHRRAVNALLYLLTFFVFLFALQVVFFDTDITSLLSFMMMMGCAALSFRVIYSLEFRQVVQQYIGNNGRYNAESMVHTTAIVLSLALLASFLLSFVLQGGIEGIAETIDDEGVAVGDIFIQATIQVAAAFFRRRLGNPTHLAADAYSVGLADANTGRHCSGCWDRGESYPTPMVVWCNNVAVCSSWVVFGYSK